MLFLFPVTSSIHRNSPVMRNSPLKRKSCCWKISARGTPKCKWGNCSNDIWPKGKETLHQQTNRVSVLLCLSQSHWQRHSSGIIELAVLIKKAVWKSIAILQKLLQVWLNDYICTFEAVTLHCHSDMIKGNESDAQILFLRYWQRKISNSFVLYCFRCWWNAHNSVTWYPILMGFASRCNILSCQNMV